MRPQRSNACLCVFLLFLCVSDSFADVNSAVVQPRTWQTQVITPTNAERNVGLAVNLSASSAARDLSRSLVPQQNEPPALQTTSLVSHEHGVQIVSDAATSALSGQTASISEVDIETTTLTITASADAVKKLTSTSPTTAWTDVAVTEAVTKMTDISSSGTGTVASALAVLDANAKLAADARVSATTAANKDNTKDNTDALSKAIAEEEVAVKAWRDAKKIASFRLKAAAADLQTAFDSATGWKTKADAVVASGKAETDLTVDQAKSLAPQAATLMKAISSAHISCAEVPDVAGDQQPCKRSEYYDESLNKCVDLADDKNFVPSPDQKTPADRDEMASIASWVTSGLAGLLLTAMTSKFMFKILLECYKSEEPGRTFDKIVQSASEKLTREKAATAEIEHIDQLVTNLDGKNHGLEGEQLVLHGKCLAHITARRAHAKEKKEEVEEELQNFGATLCTDENALKRPIASNQNMYTAFLVVFVISLLIQGLSYATIRYQKDPDFKHLDVTISTPEKKKIEEESKDVAVELDKRQKDMKQEMEDRVKDTVDSLEKAKEKLEDADTRTDYTYWLFAPQLILGLLAFGITHSITRVTTSRDDNSPKPVYLQQLHMTRHEFYQELGLDVLSFVAMALTFVRGFRPELARVDLSLNFSMMTFIQLQVGHAINDAGQIAQTQIDGKHYLPYLPGLGMMLHAVMFPFMLVLRVRSQKVDLAIKPHQLQNLHFISDFFGCIFVGVTIASSMMNALSPSFTKDMIHRFKNGAINQLIKLRHIEQYFEENAEPAAGEVPKWQKMFSDQFVDALSRIEKDYFCAAVSHFDDQHKSKTSFEEEVYRFLLEVRSCGARSMFHRFRSSRTAALEDESDVVIFKASKSQHDILATHKLKAVNRIIEIMTEPELLSEDHTSNAESLWGLVSSGYYGCIYNIIDMANGMTGDNEILGNNIYGAVFAFLLFLTSRVLLGPNHSYFSPSSKETTSAFEGKFEETDGYSLSSNPGFQCVPLWNPNDVFFLDPSCEAFCGERESSDVTCPGFVFLPKEDDEVIDPRELQKLREAEKLRVEKLQQEADDRAQKLKPLQEAEQLRPASSGGHDAH